MLSIVNHTRATHTHTHNKIQTNQQKQKQINTHFTQLNNNFDFNNESVN